MKDGSIILEPRLLPLTGIENAQTRIKDIIIPTRKEEKPNANASGI